MVFHKFPSNSHGMLGAVWDSCAKHCIVSEVLHSKTSVVMSLKIRMRWLKTLPPMFMHNSQEAWESKLLLFTPTNVWLLALKGRKELGNDMWTVLFLLHFPSPGWPLSLTLRSPWLCQTFVELSSVCKVGCIQAELQKLHYLFR